MFLGPRGMASDCQRLCLCRPTFVAWAFLRRTGLPAAAHRPCFRLPRPYHCCFAPCLLGQVVRARSAPWVLLGLAVLRPLVVRLVHQQPFLRWARICR